VTAREPSRPFYVVFLERVIKIDAVQRHRAAVTDEYAEKFFDAGSRLSELDDFHWSLDAPELVSQRFQLQLLGGPRSFTFPEEAISPAMQVAWDAAMVEWRAFIAELQNRELSPNGTHPTTGDRRDIDSVELMRAGLVFDVRNGDLFSKERDGKLIERWGSITLRPAEQPLPVEQPPAVAITPRPAIQEPKLGVIDWDDWWDHECERRERNELPPKKAYLDQAKALIRTRYQVTHVPETVLKRIKAALYRGDPERPRR
jgi:hypothetical protein